MSVCAVSLLSCVHSLGLGRGLGLDLGYSLDWKKGTRAHTRVVKLPKKTRRLIPNDTRDFSVTPAAATKYFAALVNNRYRYSCRCQATRVGEWCSKSLQR